MAATTTPKKGRKYLGGKGNFEVPGRCLPANETRVAFIFRSPKSGAGVASRVDPALLYAFHTSHGAAPDAYSPCMHREDAGTVSFSWVVVTREEVRFLYSPSAPCQCSPCEQRLLARDA